MLLRFLGPTQRTCDGWTRRDLLHAGGLAALNVCLPQLLGQAHAAPAATAFGRAKACVVIYLFGGPSHIDLWVLKPDAPAEFRGEFRPIATNVPGIRIGEHLPRTAGIMDKLAIVRSMCTHSDLHDASAYWVLTGYKYQGTQSRQISPTDWPYLGPIVKLLK